MWLFRSAYHHYSRISSALVKDELTREGKDSSLGTVVSLVSTKVSQQTVKPMLGLLLRLIIIEILHLIQYHFPNSFHFIHQWKTLSEDEKAPYVKMAKDDKARYDAECFVSSHMNMNKYRNTIMMIRV